MSPIHAPGMGGMDCTPPGIHYQVPKERKPRPVDPFHIPGKETSKDRGRKTDPRHMVVPVPSPANAEKRVTIEPVINRFARVQDFAKAPSPKVSNAQRKVENRVRSALDPKYAGGYFEFDSAEPVPTVKEQEAEKARLEAEIWESIDNEVAEPEKTPKAKLTRSDLIDEMMGEMFDGLRGMKKADPDLMKRVVSRRIRMATLENFDGAHKHPIYRALSSARVDLRREGALSFEIIRETVRAALRRVDEEKSRKKETRNEARRFKETMSASQFKESVEGDQALVAKQAVADNEQRLKDLYPEAHDPNAQPDKVDELLEKYPEAFDNGARVMEELLRTYPEMLAQDSLPEGKEEAIPSSAEPMRRPLKVRIA